MIFQVGRSVGDIYSEVCILRTETNITYGNKMCVKRTKRTTCDSVGADAVFYYSERYYSNSQDGWTLQ